MAGTRIPSNAAPTDSAIMSTASNMNAASFYANSAQTLYTGLWQDMRSYVDTYYCNVSTSRQHSGARTDFSASPSNQSSLSSHQTYSFPRNMDATVEFANLMNTGSDDNPTSLDNDSSNNVAPTIQFDLGSNFLRCSSQQGNLQLANYSTPYDYSCNAGIDAQENDANQACFANNSSSLDSTLWNLGDNFACPSNPTNLSSTTNLDNVSTVDYTARWDLGSNNSSRTINQSSPASNNHIRTPPSEPFERRLRPYVREPSRAVEQRIEKALEHRLYMIDKKLVGDPQSPTACDYQVLGATGNLYTVRLATIPSCTCPDSNSTCKHILFIMLRVLKLSPGDYRIWQTTLTSGEVGPLLKQCRVDSDVLASLQVRQRFQEISNQSTEGGGDGVDAEQLQNLRREVGGDCPVCFEMMGSNQDGSAKEELSFCKVCGNNVHKDCFKRWSMSKQEAGERPTCILCRSLWFEDDRLQLTKRKAASDLELDGYVNLTDYSADHRAEDMTLERLYPNVRPRQLREWRGC